MILIILMYLSLIQSKVLAKCGDGKKDCTPECHYWQPYYNEIPPYAYIATPGKHADYIAKVIPLDAHSWSIPVQFHSDYAAWAWPTCTTTRVDKFIEILCIQLPELYQWRQISNHTDMEDALKKCCLVEAGIIHVPERHFAYIGRTCWNDKWYVGVAYLTEVGNFHAGLYAMDGWNSIYFEKNFEVLHYGCWKLECKPVKD